jgi:hypothetical protein
MAQPEGKIEAVAESAPCPCDSGRSHGECCGRNESTGWYLFTFPDGRFLHMRKPQIQTSLIRTVAPPYVEFLIKVAGLSLQAAQRPDAGEYGGLIALLTTATALEALVNRLLETVLPPEKWKKIEKKASHEAKWLKLYGALKIKPELSPDRSPLRDFRELIAARNRLIHYKHGEHVETFQMPAPSSWKLGPEGGELDVKLPKQLPALPDSILRSLMAPSKAPDYAAILVAMTRPILAAHPSDAFGVAQNLSIEIDRLEVAIAAARAATTRTSLRRPPVAAALQGLSIAAGIGAALYWYVASAGPVPPLRTYWDAAPASDPFYGSILESAQRNKWAALLTLASVALSIAASIVRRFRARSP